MSKRQNTKRTHDPNQFDLFSGTELDPVILKEKDKPKAIERKDLNLNEIKSEKDILLWFAKRSKQSLAFLECVLNGLLPGNYHGEKLWIRRWKNIWINEPIENADYWIEKGYKVINSKETVCIIQI